MSKEPIITARDVNVFYGAKQALNGINLDVPRNKVTSLIGPSGCGKTTLLRAIAGLDLQSAGKVEQAGQDVSNLPPSERDFGIVFQSYALFPNLTIEKNIAYGLENAKRPKAEVKARVAELLALVGLPDQGRKYPAQLSGGQQQRIALARAIATKPGLLLLDEPLSALDAKVRVFLRHEVKALQRTLGITTVMVTHDQEEALSMADRIVVMNHGVIEQVGSPLEIYRDPASLFVADFIGAMNQMPAEAGSGVVKVGSVELQCNNNILSGDVVVTIRPEDVLPVEIPGENTLEVTINSMEFLGSFYRAELSNPELGAVELSADFSINAVRRLGLEQGASLHVQLPAGRLKTFPVAS